MGEELVVGRMMDKGRMFRGMSEKIIEEWERGNIIKSKWFIMGMSLTRGYNEGIREKLVEIIYKELHKKFDERYIKVGEEGEYYFTISVEYGDNWVRETCVRITTEEEEGEAEEYKEGEEYGIRFIIKTQKTVDGKKIVKYKRNEEIFKNGYYMEEIGESDNMVGRLIVNDWLEVLCRKKRVFETLLEKEYLVDKINKIIKETGENKEHDVFYISLKIKINKENVVILSQDIKDIEKDSTILEENAKRLGVDLEKITENNFVNYHQPDSFWI